MICPLSESRERHSSKDPRTIDVLETTEKPKNSPTGIRASSHKKPVGSISQLKAFTPMHAACAKTGEAGSPGVVDVLQGGNPKGTGKSPCAEN